MQITGFGFLLFLAASLIAYYTFCKQYQPWFLLLISILFIFSHSVFGIVFMILSSLCVYLSALKYPGQTKGVLISVVVTVGLLIGLKYVPSISFLHMDTALISKWLFPIGISYYTLQLLSYSIDVYREKIPAETQYWKVLLFTCYFPQLVQGPISRYDQLEPQLVTTHAYSSHNIKYGVQLMLWGVFKKMVIADRYGKYVRIIFESGTLPKGLAAWLGLLYYGFQLYGDFSGGIDIIRGISQCFGIDLVENFRQPYFSKSLGEFWRRWHISLGSWMKDYMFYPLSMSKWMRKIEKKLKKLTDRKTSAHIVGAISNILVFLLVGIWHGTGTNFTAWGLYNGCILAFSTIAIPVYAKMKKSLHITGQERWYSVFCVVRTFLIVTIGWIFDTTYTAHDAGILFKNLFVFSGVSNSLLPALDATLVLCATLVLLYVDIQHEKGVSLRDTLNTKPFIVQVIVWTVMIQCIACFGRVASAGGFLYANF